jgi:hypothetical protein
MAAVTQRTKLPALKQLTYSLQNREQLVNILTSLLQKLTIAFFTSHLFTPSVYKS